MKLFPFHKLQPSFYFLTNYLPTYLLYRKLWSGFSFTRDSPAPKACSGMEVFSFTCSPASQGLFRPKAGGRDLASPSPNIFSLSSKDRPRSCYTVRALHALRSERYYAVASFSLEATAHFPARSEIPMPSENSSEPTSEFLTTDELDALLSLDDTLTLGKVVPTDRRPPDPRRKRQTYRPRYRSMMQAWARRLRAYHMDLGRFYAIAHARSKDIKSGNTALPTEPSVGLVDWGQRRCSRGHRDRR